MSEIDDEKKIIQAVPGDGCILVFIMLLLGILALIFLYLYWLLTLICLILIIIVAIIYAIKYHHRSSILHPNP
ncbi:MAG: hypothetical protein EAX89_11940 [Candidatus Lokiarchaeota archaeon]|nr:hypothetical protein [Candidatus Lokiarchaeota archaeon]